MSIVNAIAKMAKPAAKILMGAAVTAGAVSVFSSCQKENPHINPNNPVKPPVPFPDIVSPDLDPELHDFVYVFCEGMQGYRINIQYEVEEIISNVNDLPLDKQNEFWGWFRDHMPYGFGFIDEATTNFLYACYEKISELLGN